MTDRPGISDLLSLQLLTITDGTFALNNAFLAQPIYPVKFSAIIPNKKTCTVQKTAAWSDVCLYASWP